jgi:CheY-like chemotaxis protein
MNEFVKGLDWLLRRAVGQRIRLETDLPPDLPEAHADPDLLEQVLLNLAMNARDAMSDGGVLRVRTRVEAIDEIRAREQADVAAGSYLRLELIDDGTGMPELVRRRAFEPFFTTKPKGAGTGLGLATTYGIVKQMGGFVEIDSEVGHGTVMKVYLPVAGHVVEEPAATAVGGDERILLVEDEEGVRRITARILTESGYTVLSAAHPREALAILGEGPVDLVLTDVVMPGMSGGMLVARMREDAPRLRAVFMSGYTDRPDALPRDADFIAKPFTRQALLERVAQALATG